MRQTHRSTALPLLRFRPGGVLQELVAQRGAKVGRLTEKKLNALIFWPGYLCLLLFVLLNTQIERSACQKEALLTQLMRF